MQQSTNSRLRSREEVVRAEFKPIFAAGHAIRTDTSKPTAATTGLAELEETTPCPHRQSSNHQDSGGSVTVMLVFTLPPLN
jgi:hypothetical protein